MSQNDAGERLKKERERKGLSVKQAADSLHLDTWAIEAMESSSFAALGPPVYVKGHLQKYATLLELDCAELLSLYETQQESAPALTPLSLSMRMGGRRRWKLLIWIALVVLVAGLAAVGWLWWTQR